MELFKKIKSLGVFLGIILILVGVVFLVFPEQVIKFLALIVGTGILIYGAFNAIVLAVKWNELPKKRVLRLILAAVFVLLGIFLLIYKDVTISAAGIVIGLLAVLSAFDRFLVAVERRKEGLKSSSTFLFGLIHLVLGVGMIYASLQFLSYIVIFAGIYVLIAGIMVILSTCYFFDF